MSRTIKIDTAKAIEMRVNGVTLRQIGASFGVSAEAVRQALDRVQEKKRESKRLARLLMGMPTEESSIYPMRNIGQIISDWTTILEAARRSAALESEIITLKDRLSKIEKLLTSKSAKAERKKSVASVR